MSEENDANVKNPAEGEGKDGKSGKVDESVGENYLDL